jgi:hypothetical protein
MRKTTIAMALVLLWAPTGQAFGVQNSATTAPVTRSPVVLSAVSNTNDSFDWDALDRKNASRKKFGLKPMTPDEFLANEALVSQMALEQQQKAVEFAASRKQAASQSSPTTPVTGLFEKIFGDIVPDTCESNYDCDFGFGKVCCASGHKQRSREGELAYVPVPVDVFPPSAY